MQNAKRVIAVATLVFMSVPGFALAQDRGQDHPAKQDQHSHQDQHSRQAQPSHYVHHSNWHKGGRISHADWERGRAINYRNHHLRQPPRGYEWREVDGNYVLAAVATGVIASVIIASQGH